MLLFSANGITNVNNSQLYKQMQKTVCMIFSKLVTNISTSKEHFVSTLCFVTCPVMLTEKKPAPVIVQGNTLWCPKALIKQNALQNKHYNTCVCK